MPNLSRIERARTTFWGGIANSLQQYGGLSAAAPLLPNMTGGLLAGSGVQADHHRLMAYAIRHVYAQNKKTYATLSQLQYIDNCEEWSTRFNPIPSVVAFYEAHTLPDLEFHIEPVDADGNPDTAPTLPERAGAVLDALETVRDSAEFSKFVDAYVRSGVVLFDSFIKAETKAQPNEAGEMEAVGAYPKHIPAQTVRAFEADERGHLTAIRIDTPQARGVKITTAAIRVEVWRNDFEDEAGRPVGGVKVFEIDAGLYHNALLENSAENQDVYAVEQADLLDSKSFDELGYDFIPFVHKCTPMMWFDLTDQIDEVNRLHHLAAKNNLPTVLVTNDWKDKAGRPMPATPTGDMANQLGGRGGGTHYNRSVNRPYTNGGGVSAENADGLRVISLPGGADAAPMPSPIDLTANNAQIAEIKADVTGQLPEYSIETLGNMDQVAEGTIERLQGNARQRVEALRETLEDGLVRAFQMCLHIGQVNSVEGFGTEQIGTFNGGDWEFTFQDRPIFANTSSQIAATATQLTKDAGAPLVWALRYAGVTDEALLDELQQALDAEAVRQRLATAAALGQIAAGVDPTGVRPGGVEL